MVSIMTCAAHASITSSSKAFSSDLSTCVSVKLLTLTATSRTSSTWRSASMSRTVRTCALSSSVACTAGNNWNVAPPASASSASSQSPRAKMCISGTSIATSGASANSTSVSTCGTSMLLSPSAVVSSRTCTQDPATEPLESRTDKGQCSSSIEGGSREPSLCDAGQSKASLGLDTPLVHQLCEAPCCSSKLRATVEMFDRSSDSKSAEWQQLESFASLEALGLLLSLTCGNMLPTGLAVGTLVLPRLRSTDSLGPVPPTPVRLSIIFRLGGACFVFSSARLLGRSNR
mmetsp:Transcript_66382/g.175762  ORF Transcript_66382/g.175762 Transcript_66382/m.175762 type:complete len:288 (+) Transcript_66382:1469-2332(+)